MVKRIVVGAHYGLRDWLVQRVTAAIITLYTLFLLVVLIVQPPFDFAGWRGLFAHTWMRVPTLLCLLAVFLHAWVGVRDILMDYIKPTMLRLLLQVGVAASLVAYALWSVQMLWSL